MNGISKIQSALVGTQILLTEYITLLTKLTNYNPFLTSFNSETETIPSKSKTPT